MNRCPILAHNIAILLLATAALMRSGAWCPQCQDEAEEDCLEGTCQVVEHETWVDHEAFHHTPAVDFGGGD